MKTSRKTIPLSILCGCLVGLTAGGQTTIEGFEYATDWDMQAVWFPQSATLTLSSYVAAGSEGTNSLRIDRYFPANPWETEVITGPYLLTPVSIGADQYVTLRVAGDPEFTNATYQTLFLYAWDANGNFGRWGSPVPTSTNWQVFNFQANTIAQPWDSPGLPDLTNIVQFKMYLYGQGDPPGVEFPATIYVDDIMIRDTPLIEFPPPSPMRGLIDDFEGYADDAALMSFYHYINSPAATATAASLETPAPQGSKALKLAIDFAAGQWPWGCLESAEVDPFSLPTNAVVQVRIKGDPALAPVADGGTVFWLAFYDQGGRRIVYSTASPAVTTAEWTTLKAGFNAFWSDSAAVDTGNLVRWRILYEGWQGTADSPALSGTFYVDDIRITVPPGLAIIQDGDSLKLKMDGLITGTTYTVQQTTDFSGWTTATTFQATSDTETWTIPAGDKAFYQVYYTP